MDDPTPTARMTAGMIGRIAAAATIVTFGMIRTTIAIAGNGRRPVID